MAVAFTMISTHFAIHGDFICLEERLRATGSLSKVQATVFIQKQFDFLEDLRIEDGDAVDADVLKTLEAELVNAISEAAKSAASRN